MNKVLQITVLIGVKPLNIDLDVANRPQHLSFKTQDEHSSKYFVFQSEILFAAYWWYSWDRRHKGMLYIATGIFQSAKLFTALHKFGM